MKKDLILEYFVPIESSAEIDGDFTINGIAINETTTSNGHKFLGEELRMSANSLIGVPLLKDHNNSVDSIVGKVKTAHFSEESRNIPFKAVVKDQKIKELIKDGLLNTVSVGAHVNPADIEQSENGDIIPHNITFKELSVVAIPADGGATFSVALNNALSSYSQNENSDSSERGNETMTEEKITEKSTTPEEKEEVKVTEQVTEEKVKSWVTEAILAMKESDADEEKSEPAKEEPKEEEEESEEVEEVEEKGDYKFNQSFNSFSMERKSYNYN